ncbi:YbaB/EbfC family nucleoid-associated protein [Actinokineospora diospyrosa]|uniref:YbaB/EbfC DNA-binding family protein n=1 Tax=Actinokineospora diospyrosa TaxID=103728 RepID=A0ABT1ID59_9PSEU|nr:YbaB/EbfC family nucleoid-associated protein [Actinokineospora diospyrosa]MCP2270565.1 YbaB/EbfC DNA-binding family protein [Actinokineospora diospyrosa]
MALDDAFQQSMRRFEEQAAAAAGLRERIGELKGSARNTDGSVTVTVAPSGAVLGLALTPAAMNRSHTQLTQEILGTIRAATQQAAAQVEEVVRPAVGDAYYEQFQAALRAHAPAVQPLGPTPPPEPAALPQPGAAPVRKPRPPVEDDGDFSDETIYGGPR